MFSSKNLLDDRVNLSSQIAIAIVIVTGKYSCLYESEKETSPTSFQTNEAFTLVIKTIENLKGKFNENNISAETLNCDSGSGKLMQIFLFILRLNTGLFSIMKKH